MSSDELDRLLKSKTWRAEFMACDDGKLRLFLQDLETGDCGLLAIEPVQLALPDERALEYSWQDVRAELGPPPDEQLYDIATRLGPDYERGEVPFLFD